MRDESRRVIAEMQARYAEETGTRQLKIKHNNFLGYYIETPQAQGEALLKAADERDLHPSPDDGRRDALHHQRADRTGGAHRLGGRPRAGARARCVRAAAPARRWRESETLRGVGAALAEIDVAAALAELAVKRDLVAAAGRRFARLRDRGRPPSGRRGGARRRAASRSSPTLAIFPARSDEGGRLALVTGPNMAGKSTFLRQNALIAVLAQMGAFVPAKRAHIGVVDRLFSRVGAADDLARGRSTFMVEMVETAAILNQATRRSLVILDEIGRGTATFDGLSIAFACVEHLNAVNRSRALFATHFHELTQLALTLPRLFNLTMRVSEWKGALVFLHEVVPGAADRSYGIQVAKLAGLPAAVIKRARAVLAELEATRHAGAALSGELDALPLFSYEPPPPPGPDPLREALAKLDPDALTPREAQATLYELKRLSREENP